MITEETTDKFEMSDSKAEELFLAGVPILMVVKTSNKNGLPVLITRTLRRNQRPVVLGRRLFFECVCEEKSKLRRQGYPVMERAFFAETPQ